MNKIKTDEMGQNSLLDWTQCLAYTQTVGKVDISIAAVHYRNELQSAGVINTLLADAGVVWRLKRYACRPTCATCSTNADTQSPITVV